MKSMINKYVTNAFTDHLIKCAKKNKKFVILDADLSDDLNLKKFSTIYPHRFIQNGIAEQDMISMAGGISLMGLTPIVNSFASFLTSRGNEQIYNNSTEGTKIIYICLYAGSMPAGAGKSHQSLRDISLLSSIPNFKIFHPYNYIETEQILSHCLNKKEKNNCAIRLSIGPMPKESPPLGKNYKFKLGRGISISKGNDGIIFTYGQTMVTEAYKTYLNLKKGNINLEIINMSCINYFDKSWLKQKVEGHKNIFFLEDHSFNGGISDLMISFLTQNNLIKNHSIFKFGFRDFPACGTYEEVLKFHHLDHVSLAKKIKKKLKNEKH